MADSGKPSDFSPILAILLMLLGVVGMLSRALPMPLSLFCAFTGGGIHFLHGIRTGELTTRFLFLEWPWTVTRDESPTYNDSCHHVNRRFRGPHSILFIQIILRSGEQSVLCDFSECFCREPTMRALHPKKADCSSRRRLRQTDGFETSVGLAHCEQWQKRDQTSIPNRREDALDRVHFDLHFGNELRLCERSID
jgi:hypothetical protein